jgi:hypothetical protein
MVAQLVQEAAAKELLPNNNQKLKISRIIIEFVAK